MDMKKYCIIIVILTINASLYAQLTDGYEWLDLQKTKIGQLQQISYINGFIEGISVISLKPCYKCGTVSRMTFSLQAGDYRDKVTLFYQSYPEFRMLYVSIILPYFTDELNYTVYDAAKAIANNPAFKDLLKIIKKEKIKK